MQELGRVHDERMDAGRGQQGDGDMAGIVRGPHPGEDHRTGLAEGAAGGGELAALIAEASRGPPKGVRLAQDLGQESVR